ncbi:methylated-DNA--[protein]-cysteine S-methyltransferase [Alteromonas portus]|uniref:methylated-DNA--[protein]-cysteine S-methyltransferase n=1 Tax=Alteromonas portus TaxID=2565549 RepID=UPI003BF91033
MIYTGFVSSEQGLIKVEATQTGITSIAFVNAAEPENTPYSSRNKFAEFSTYQNEVLKGNKEHAERIGDDMQAYSNAITDEACRQLSAYFDGKLNEFDLPLSAKGTAFQHSVWDALQQVKYGETASYLDIANAIGNPKAVRAVGMANGRNPIAIVVPCHRIIGSNKTLTGYAGGLPRKQYLLNLEGAQGVLWS